MAGSLYRIVHDKDMCVSDRSRHIGGLVVIVLVFCVFQLVREFSLVLQIVPLALVGLLLTLILFFLVYVAELLFVLAMLLVPLVRLQVDLNLEELL